MVLRLFRVVPDRIPRFAAARLSSPRPDHAPLLPPVPAPGRSRIALIFILSAVLPIGYLGFQVGTWIRDVPHWDEFDTVLAFLLTLDLGGGWSEFVRQCLAVNNEHRMLVSRLIFAASYWFTGGVNFAALAVIGNLFLLGTFAVLLVREESTHARLRLAAVFGLAVFHLQHHESLFWAGSSIDHFFVVLAAVSALGALASRKDAALPVGLVAGFLASFSLAHGLLIWPVGLALLALQRRKRAALVWSLTGAATFLAFFAGFSFNPGHVTPGFAQLPTVLVFALRLVGSSAAIGSHDLAPWLGALLVAGAGAAALRGATSREWFAFSVIAWCLAAALMIAWGRALLSNTWAPVASRYVILSSICWALLLWLLLERILVRFPGVRWWPAPVLGSLLVFNLAANRAYENAGRIFATAAEHAIRTYHDQGSFAQAATPPYPDPERADALIREVDVRGIYHLPTRSSLQYSTPRPLPVQKAKEIADAAYFIEDVVIDALEIRVRGWAFRNGETARPGDIAIVFRSSDRLVAYEAIPQTRPDVAEAFERWDAIYSGFELRLRREQLPQGDLGVGIGFDLTHSPQFMMTAHTVANRPDGQVSSH